MNVPQQARSQETLSRFLEAAEALLREKLFDDITIAEIVTRADRTVGSFYARFEDKTALIKTLTAERLRQIRNMSDELLDPDEWGRRPVRELVETSMYTITRLFHDYGHIFRAGLALAASDADGREQRNRHYDYLARGLSNALLAHPEVDPERRAEIELAAEMVGALLDSRLIFRQPEDDRPTDEYWRTTAEELTGLFLRSAGL